MAAGDKGDKSRIGWAIVAEDDYDDGGAANTTYNMRVRPGGGLKNEPDNKEWEEAQPDRMSRGTSLVGNKAAGEITANLHLDDPVLPLLLERGLMCNPSVAAPVTVAATTVSAVDNSFNGTGIGANLVVGQMFVSSTRTNPVNNGEFRVAPGSGANKVIAQYGTLATEASATCTLTGSTMMRNGLIRKSLALEKYSTDIVGRRFLWKGQCVNSWGLDVNAQDFLALKFGLMGRAAVMGSSPGLPGAYTAAGSTKPLDASNHISAFRADGALYVPWSKFGFSFDNKLAPYIIGGTLQPDGYSLGKIAMTVNMETFYVEGDPNFDLAYDNDESSMAFRCHDPISGKTAWFTCPLFDFTGDPTPQDGAEGPAMVTTQGTAKYDPVTQCVLQVDLFD